MRIHPVLFGVLVLAVFLGTIEAFQAAGVWSVSGKITTDGQSVQPMAGDVDSIKGWMTLEQITTTYQVPLPELLAAFSLPADTPASAAVKDLESETFSVTNLREWLKSRAETGVPEPEEAEPQPEAQPVDVVSPAPTPQPTATPAAPEPAATATAEHAAPEKKVTGKTTFQNLLDWGVTQEVIEQALGGPMPLPSVEIKAYATGKGLEFAPLKTALQAAVDAVK